MVNQPHVYPKLSQPVWLAAKLKTPDAARLFARATRRIDRFYASDTDTRHDLSRSDGLALYSVVPTPALFDVPLVLAEPDFHACSTHIMATAYDPSSRNKAGYLRHLASELSGSLPPIWKMPPPISYVCHAVRMDAIYAATDFFGSGRVYCAAGPDFDLLASSLAAIALATERCPAVDEDAWASYAAFDWILDDRSFLSGVSVLPPGATARLTRDKAGWVRSHDYACVLQHGAQSIDGSEVIAAGQRIISATSRIATPEPARIGLTGGRDSRFLSAMAIDLGIDARFDTFWPPSLEADVAAELVSAAPRALDWTKNRFDPEQVPTGPAAFDATASYWFQLFEGDGWPSNAGRSVPDSALDPHASPYQRWNMSDHPGAIARWNLSGWGGEIVRHHFYGPKDLEHPSQRIQQFLSYRRRIPEIVSQSARETSAAMLEAIIAEGWALGLKGLHLLDWIYVRSQQRRRVPVAFSPGAAFPLFTPQMFLAGFARPAAEKIGARLVADLTVRLIPGWKDVPYFDEVSKKMPISEVNKTLSRRLYWEGDRENFLHFVGKGLEGMEQHFEPGALDAFARIERDDPKAAQLQNVSNRLFWRLGFEDFLGRIQTVQAENSSLDDDMPAPTAVRTWFSSDA